MSLKTTYLAERISIRKELILTGIGSRQLIPNICSFFTKVENSINSIDNSDSLRATNELITAVASLVKNTRKYEALNPDDLKLIGNIFSDLENMFHLVLHRYSAELYYKIRLISDVLYQNMLKRNNKETNLSFRNGMMFKSYKNLYDLIHKIVISEKISEYASEKILKFYLDFSKSLKSNTEKSEEEKFNQFMELIA